MSEKKKAEIIANLEHTIKGGGIPSSIVNLQKILENVKNDTHVIPKRRGRTPKAKNREKDDK